MKEFIRENLVFNGRGSKFTPDEQHVALVEFFPATTVEVGNTGRVSRIVLDKEEAESLRAYLDAWLQGLD